MLICTVRYTGIQALGELYQTEVAFSKTGFCE